MLSFLSREEKILKSVHNLNTFLDGTSDALHLYSRGENEETYAEKITFLPFAVDFSFK